MFIIKQLIINHFYFFSRQQVAWSLIRPRISKMPTVLLHVCRFTIIRSGLWTISEWVTCLRMAVGPNSLTRSFSRLQAIPHSYRKMDAELCSGAWDRKSSTCQLVVASLLFFTLHNRHKWSLIPIARWMLSCAEVRETASLARVNSWWLRHYSLRFIVGINYNSL